MKKNALHTTPNILIRLSHLLGTEIENGRLEIPTEYGKGYCSGFVFNEHIRMIISNYELKEDLRVENSEATISKRVIFFKFQHIFQETFHDKELPEFMPSVLIATRSINPDEVISVHTNRATINIEVDADYLDGLFYLPEKSPILQSLLQNTQPLLFEQLIYPSLQKIVNEIINESVDKIFQLFFLKIKAEELICNLLMELEKRDEKRIYALNSHDIQIIYKVREQILSHLQIPPTIREMSAFANMSPTKLKQLFKQIFGNSIFRYYQEFRMKEAARLLKEEKMSVSEVGYQMGFSNLSHFSRVFNEHLGLNPKQYTKS